MQKVHKSKNTMRDTFNEKDVKDVEYSITHHCERFRQIELHESFEII